MRCGSTRACGTCALPTDGAGPCARCRALSSRLDRPAARSAHVGLAAGWASALAVAVAVGSSAGGGWGMAALFPAFIVGTIAGPIGGHLVDRARRIARRRRRALEARRAVADAPLTTIAGATEGLARVRGRLRVLAPAREPPGEHGPFPVLAGTPVPGPPVAVTVQAHTFYAPTRAGHPVGGRFVVDDGSGASALVDDDLIELWDEAGETPIVAIGDGAVVEVIGRGRWGTRAELTQGYRDAPELFLFEGSVEQPVHVTLLTVRDEAAGASD